MDFAGVAVGFSSYIALKCFSHIATWKQGILNCETEVAKPKIEPRARPLALVLQVRVSTRHAHGNAASAFRAASFAKNSETAIFYCLESSKNADYNEI